MTKNNCFKKMLHQPGSRTTVFVDLPERTTTDSTVAITEARSGMVKTIDVPLRLLGSVIQALRDALKITGIQEEFDYLDAGSPHGSKDGATLESPHKKMPEL